MRPRFVEGAAFVVALAVMVASLVAIATNRSGKTVQTSAIQSSAPSPTMPPPAASAPESARRGPPVKVIPTQAPRTNAVSSGPIRPGAAKPPIAGKYTYDQSSSNGTQTSTLEITDRGSGRQIENMDDGSQIDEVTWQPNAKYDNATTFQGGPGGSVRCDWNPDVTDYMFPLRAGSSWTVRSSCHPNATTEVDLSGSVHVRGTKRVTVGGELVDTWVVLTDASVTFKANGVMFTETIHDEDDFSPDHGITVRDVQTSSGKDPRSGQTTSETTTRTLKNLAPGTAA